MAYANSSRYLAGLGPIEEGTSNSLMYVATSTRLTTSPDSRCGDNAEHLDDALGSREPRSILEVGSRVGPNKDCHPK
jgi:hypothetical protein